MTVQIFVINLPEDTGRRRAIEGQLGRLELSYDVLPAIRGAQLTPDERRRQYDEKWFVRNEGRPAMPGELGCALSHLAAYRMVVERMIPYALILEDDAWLNPNLPQLLQAIEKEYLPTEGNVFLLTWISAMSGRNHGELWSSYHVAEMRSAFCAHGYVVSNAAADALIKALYPVRHLADCWGWLRRHRIVNMLAVFPTCITADLSYETRASGELAAILGERSLLRRLLHKLYRAYWRLADLALAIMRRAGAVS